MIHKIENTDAGRDESPDSRECAIEMERPAELEDINTNDLQRDLLTMN
jgi:hypothetical protein